MLLQQYTLVLILVISCSSIAQSADKKAFRDLIVSPSLDFRIEHSGRQVALSPDGKLVAVQDQSSGKLKLLLIERTSRKVLHRLPWAFYYTVTFTPDSTRLVCLRGHQGKDNKPQDARYSVDVHDVKTGKMLHEISLCRGQPRNRGGVLPEDLPYAVGDDVFVVSGLTETATVYSLKTGKALGDLPKNLRLNDFSISRDGRWLLTLDGKRTLRVWDVKKRKQDMLLYEYLRDVQRIAISPDGKWCAAMLEGDRVEIRNRATGGQKAGISFGSKEYRAGVFTADGKRLVLLAGGASLPGYEDSGLRLWDWQEEDKPAQRILIPASAKDKKARESMGWFYNLTMTSDGKRFLSYHGYKGVMQLDLQKAKPLRDPGPDKKPKAP